MNNRESPQANTNDHRFLLPHYLKPHLTAFSQELSDQGFTPSTIQGYEDSIAHFGTWLHKKRISLLEINYEVVINFAKHRCYCPGVRKKHSISQKYGKRVKRFVNYLNQHGVIDCQPNTTIKSLPPLLVNFTGHLQLRGLSPRTVERYVRLMFKLLPFLGNDPGKYDAKTIKQVICKLAKQCSRAETKNLTTALRAYLRFLTIESLCRPDLDRTVPTVAQWSLSSVPRYITAQEIKCVIDSCDIRTHKGLRDRAIILFLACLGLRAGDIVNMRIDDINWNAGTVCISGKGQREDRLPLPQDVGDAVLAYLDKARPPVIVKQIFLCLNAPYRPFSSSASISNIVAAALNRAGISDPPSRGAHLLRHSAATNMLRSGASLETVSSILRHRSLDMTAYYAKVDIPMLQKIVQPWPEDASC